MKKILVFLSFLVAATFLIACQTTTTSTTTTTSATTSSTTTSTSTSTTTTTTTTTTTRLTLTDQALVDLAYAALDLGNLTGLTNLSSRLIFAVTKKVSDGSGDFTVAISWQNDHPEVIATNGVISQPIHEIGDVTVTLTATLTYGTASREKTFVATVLALPSPEEAEPFFTENFSGFADGDILTQAGAWGSVSGKTGNSLFTVVSDVGGSPIPGGSKALKVEAFKELQIEAAMVHAYDVVVIEADIYQTASGSPINIQTSSSQPVIGFGVYNGEAGKGQIFYRTDNGTMYRTDINLNQWYHIRLEVHLVNKTIEFFYYDADGFLVSCTPGPVTFTGSTGLTSIFLRSGSSTTASLTPPSYITNLVANRIEALPRPEAPIRLGEVEGVAEEISIVTGTAYTPAVPTLYNYYEYGWVLEKDFDYSLVIDNPVDIQTNGVYTVTYTFTNLNDPEDIIVFTQRVTVFDPAAPNILNSAVAGVAGYMSHEARVEISLFRAEGTLYYAASATPLSGAEILSHPGKISLDLTETTVVLEDLALDPGMKWYFVIELNGLSNVLELGYVYETMVPITTAQEFYDAVHASESSQKDKYYLLQNDIDFTGFVWTTAAHDFVATFDGGGHKISHLHIVNETQVNGGIFYKLDGGTIRNLVLDDVTLVSWANNGNGLLVGQTYNSAVIENIVFLNSSLLSDVHGAVDPQSYAGLVVGRVRSGSTLIDNISIYECVLEARHLYAGGIVAGMEVGTTLTVSNVYLENYLVKEGTDTVAVTGEMVGGIIGRVRGNTIIKRIVAINLDVRGAKNVGGIIGKSDEAAISVILHNIYVNGSITFLPAEISYANVLVGNIVKQTPSKINVWASGFPIVGTNGMTVNEGLFIDHSAVLSEIWWTTNMVAIPNDPAWQFVDGVPMLKNLYPHTLPKHAVTIDYNMGPDDDSILFPQGTVFALEAPEVGGFRFIGWYLDAEYLQPLPENYSVDAPVTIFGKYEQATFGIVSFDAGVEGVTVASQNVNFGSTATLPTVPQTMIGGVLKRVVGWTLNGEAYSFSTPVQGDFVLLAVWETVTYTVSFVGPQGTLTQTVPYGETATIPETPTHPAFSAIVFESWNLSGVSYVFSTPVTADLTLTVAWTVPEIVEVTTREQFYWLATNETTYHYLLKNDLDFTGFTWTPTHAAFKGYLDGGNFEVSYITMSATGTTYGGIFARANGATITNLVLDHINVTAVDRAGILVGRFENTACAVSNILIRHSSVTGANSNGVGGLAALVSVQTTIANIAIIDTVVTATLQKNVGGVIGRVDSAALNATDIFVSGVLVESTIASGSDIGAGGFVGYVRDNANSIVNVDRLVILNTEIKALVGGAVIGYLRAPGEGTVSNTYAQVTFTNAVTSGLIGRINLDTGDLPIPTTSIWGSFVNEISGSRTQSLSNAPVIPAAASWWETNLPGIHGSALWVVNPDGTVLLLKAQ